MFIGKQEQSSVEFNRKGRPLGSKDKAPRKKPGMGQRVATNLAGAAALGLAVKNRKAIGGAMRAGATKAQGAAQGASSAVQGGVRDARQKVGNKLDSVGSKMQRRGGYDRVNAATSGGGYRKVDAGTRAGQRKEDRGAALRNMAKKIRGN